MRRGDVLPPEPGRDLGTPSDRVVGDPPLPAEGRSQGDAARTAFREAVARGRRSVVVVVGATGAVAFGLVVDGDGLVVTLASRLPAEPGCRLADGRVVPAEVVGADPASDLAVLRLPMGGLTAARGAADPAPSAGTLVATAGTGELPLAVGVVAVPRPDLPGPHPARIVPTRADPGGRVIRGEAEGPRGASPGSPAVFEHDAPTLPWECGAPAVDASGDVLGITAANSNPVSDALPGDAIRRVVSEAKAGKLAAHWASSRLTLGGQPGPTAPRER